MKIVSVVGTRPNFMKLAPIAREFAKRSDVEHFVVHTGQHYDATMSGAFFRELGIAAPRYSLAVGAGTHAVQTAAVLERIEPVFESEQPDMVLVYGDVNSTVAAALAAAKMLLPVAHVEAGLRSRDRTMPEELNRLVTDQLSDLLFAPSPDAVENLRTEGVAAERIHYAGNIMIDAVIAALPAVRRLDVPTRYGLKRMKYAVATLHRPANVDDPDRLRELVAALDRLSRDRPVLFPVHPRTRRRMDDLELTPTGDGAFKLLAPLGYSDMLGLVEASEVVITDSGGLQEETTYLGVPCVTVRPNTERPITVSRGTNRLVAPEREAIVGAVEVAVEARPERPPVIERWDGRTAERIVAIVCDGASFDSWHGSRPLRTVLVGA